MSEAKVKFYSLERAGEAVAGAEQEFSFQCPLYNRRCGHLIIAGRTDLKRDGQNQNDGIAQWDWNGDRDKPTFSPSVNCKGCWHGYIRNGRCVDTQGNEERGYSG